MKQDAIRKNGVKNLKRDSVNEYVQRRLGKHISLNAAVRILDDPYLPTSCTRTKLMDQNTYKDIRILYSLKYKHSKK